MSESTCRACGSNATRVRGRKTGSFIRREFEFRNCVSCGLLFVNPFSGFEIYDDAYYRGAGPDPFVDYENEYHHWKTSDRRHELDDLVRLGAEHLARESSRTDPDEPVRWLDFGCGAGALLKCLREKGSVAGRRLELTGHDVGSWAQRLRNVDGMNVVDYRDLASLPAASFDVISMIEVIEHLPLPRDPIRQAARLLRPGGLLLLTTGNLRSLAARWAGLRYHYCAPEIHVSLFDPECLSRLYASEGLEPIRVRYRGVVRFKVLKTLRHRPLLRKLASVALHLPLVVRGVDLLYGVSAMPCAVKPR